MAQFNDEHFTEEEKNLCPNRGLLDTTWYDFADCGTYGSSDCAVTMRSAGICDMTAEDVEEDIEYKYR